MSVVVRTITTEQVTVPSLANIVVANAAGNNVLAMSRDRRTVYACGAGGASGQAATKLRQSFEDGAFSDVYTFPENVNGFVELPDGEAMVTTFNGSTVRRLYRSTGWAASHTTATWAVVLELGAQIVQDWSLHEWSCGANGVMVVNEYSGQTTSGDQASAGRRVWLSEDFGKTWRVIYDLAALGQQAGVVTLHLHGCCYDELWDRIWITFGDQAGSQTIAGGTDKATIGYSDDRGGTWQYLPVGRDYRGQGTTFRHQATTIVPLEDAIVAMPDGEPWGIAVFPRIGYRQVGDYVMGSLWAGSIGQAIHRAADRPDLPALATVQTASAQGRPPALWAITEGGRRTTELWRHDATGMTADGMYLRAVGPTRSGKVYMFSSWTNSAAYVSSMVTADFIAAPLR